MNVDDIGCEVTGNAVAVVYSAVGESIKNSSQVVNGCLSSCRRA